jgi:acyl carrier protein
MMEPVPQPAADSVRATCLALAVEAVATILERDASTLGADSPLSAHGFDSVALVMWADVVEHELRMTHGFDVEVPDSALRGVSTVSDLAERLEPVVRLALRGPLAGSGVPS